MHRACLHGVLAEAVLVSADMHSAAVALAACCIVVEADLAAIRGICHEQALCLALPSALGAFLAFVLAFALLAAALSSALLLGLAWAFSFTGIAVALGAHEGDGR